MPSQNTAGVHESTFALLSVDIAVIQSCLFFSLLYSNVGTVLQVRAFNPWPGAKQKFDIVSDKDGTTEIQNIKILKTVVGKEEDWKGEDVTDITATKDALHVHCDDGTILSILQLQLPGKAPVTPRALANGKLQGKTFYRASS